MQELFMKQFSLLLRGTLILTAASLFSRFFGFFYKIFLAQALGAEGLGIYQLIFPVFSVCHALTVSGTETAISRFTAFHQNEEQGSYLYAGLSLSLVASTAAGALLWSHSSFLASELLHEERCEPLLQILGIVLPLSSIHSCYAGFCLGQKKAGLPAAAQLLEQLARIGAVWLFCLILTEQKRPITPVLAVSGLLAGEAASAIFMLTFAGSRQKTLFSLPAHIQKCRTLLRMALPLTFNRLSITLLQSAEAVLIPLSLQRFGLTSREALSLYGILTGMALSFLLFPNAVTSSISSMLLPLISEEQSRGHQQSISAAIEGTIRFGLVIGIFCMGVFFRYGVSLGTLFFHEPLAGQFLMTLSFICPFLYLTGNLNSILHGLGKISTVFFNQLTGLSVRILFILLFAPVFGIQGVLWGLLASQLLLCLLGFHAVSPYVTFTAGLDDLVLKPLAAVFLSIGGIELIKHFIPALRLSIEILNLILSIGSAALIYILLLLFFGVWKISSLVKKRLR